MKSMSNIDGVSINQSTLKKVFDYIKELKHNQRKAENVISGLKDKIKTLEECKQSSIIDNNTNQNVCDLSLAYL